MLSTVSLQGEVNGAVAYFPVPVVWKKEDAKIGMLDLLPTTLFFLYFSLFCL